MGKLKKFSVQVIAGTKVLEEVITAEKYRVQNDGSCVVFYKNETNASHGEKVASYPADKTIVKPLGKLKKSQKIDDLELIDMRRRGTEGKIIELEDGVIKVLQFLCSSYNETAIELTNIGKGEPIYDRYNSIYGFISNLNEDLKITFKRLDGADYMADIYFYYKDLCVMSAKIHSGNKHWNGDVKKIELYDSYAREETRHELEKPFQQYLTWIVNTIYNPMMEKTNEQKFFKDELYDEYLESLEEKILHSPK